MEFVHAKSDAQHGERKTGSAGAEGIAARRRGACKSAETRSGRMRGSAREYGDIVRLPVVMQERILLNHPDFIEQVLVIQQGKFHKSELTKRITGRLLGQGLLISEGEFWRRQRRLAQPAFHRSRINEYARHDGGDRAGAHPRLARWRTSATWRRR